MRREGEIPGAEKENERKADKGIRHGGKAGGDTGHAGEVDKWREPDAAGRGDENTEVILPGVLH